MNRNGVWDYRETPTQAWRRLGLIGEREELTQERYVNCIKDVAEKLANEGFFSDETVNRYIENAKQQDLSPSALFDY